MLAALIASGTVAVLAIGAFIYVVRRLGQADDAALTATRKSAEMYQRVLAAENAAGTWRAAADRLEQERNGEREARRRLQRAHDEALALLATNAPHAVVPEIAGELRRIADLGKPPKP